MKNIKELWQFLNGKKTTIGMLLMLLAQGSQAFFPKLITPDQVSFLISAGALIGGVGVVHKGAKTPTAQNLISKIKPRKNLTAWLKTGSNSIFHSTIFSKHLKK